MDGVNPVKCLCLRTKSNRTVRKLLTTGTEDRWCPISLYILRLKPEVGMDGLTWAVNCLSANLVVVTTKLKAKRSLLLLCDSFLMLTYEWTHLA